ncbi:MAG: BREX-4 system phosphatase PglZ [Bacteroidaceae bacterium]|nr:BREX-4 system phosphatase PglZ [Bacteroidaceae bacterium]
MDTSEKVKIFSSFDELTLEITKDRDTHDMLAQRYAIRFIMLNNFNEFRELAKFMTNIGMDTLDLETLIDADEDDTWITKDTLKAAIKACKNSTFITPFSEVVRFYNDDDFRGFFNEIMLLEDIYNPNKRIYIPLIGLQNRFTDFLNHFARIQESAPIWRYDAEAQSVEVFFAKYKDFVLPNESVQCQLDSLRDWLMFWKKQAPQERIVCTSIPIAAKYKYSKPDNIFNFTRIANAYEFMTQFLDLRFPFEYDEDEKPYWEELLKKLDNSKLENFSFEAFVRASLNKVTLTAADVIFEWTTNATASSYERWLLRNYVLYTGFADLYPYIRTCLDSVSNLSDENQLVSMIATRILYNDIPANKFSEYASERRNIIVENRFLFERMVTGQDQNWLFERIREIFQGQGDLNSAIELCTGVFDFEKKLLMGWYVYNPNHKKLAEAVSSFYPDFEAYTTTNQPSIFRTENQWFIDYIKAYKRAKMEDKYLDEIDNFIKTQNNTAANFYKWYFEFEETRSVLAEVNSNDLYRPDVIYWIDGLGAEFLSYILYLIAQENTTMMVVRSQITRSNLPSSTLHNRFDDPIVKKYGALDELGHDSHGYKHFDTLKDELKVIKNIIQDILTNCKNQKCTVAIVSDHGLSCLSRKAPSKKYDGKFEHEGRYIKTSDDALTDPDYLVHENEEEGQKYKIALTHSSLSKVPTHQVHGGCTPEEVLVPFILLSNKDLKNSVKYQIKYTGEDIMLSNPVVNVTVIPQPESVDLTCNGKTYKMDRDGTQWKALLQNITEGTHTMDIKPAGAESKEIQIKIVGIGGNTDINEMFDL